ncbi:hypothetical protein C3V39_00315 [Prevotella sp. oral taxon 820]|nr:hypothetical protein C3V39_00315 [Prevotella sp. oral taxon 820]
MSNQRKDNKMRHKHLFHAALLLTAMVLAGCANDETTQVEDTQIKTATETVAVTFMNEEPAAQAEPTTRTSIQHSFGNGATPYWSADDKIWVKDTEGNFRQSGAGEFNSDMTHGVFTLSGTFTNGCMVNYTGANGTAGDKVTIATEQTQSQPNDFSHAGVSGDCGTATASGNGSAFKFKLDHKAVYLAVMPRCTNAALGQNIYLTKVVVTSAGTNIAGTFDFSTGSIGTAASGARSVTLSTKDATAGSSYENGFPLTNTTTSQATNAAYMVIAPGTHTLTVDCYIYDPATKVEGAISQTISGSFNAGAIYDVTANVTPKIKRGIDSYYMWDAVKPYWNGVTLPDVLINNTNYTTYGSIPTTGTDRWYNTEEHSVGFLTNASHSCKDAPNVNELYYYVKYGDPHYDKNCLWSFRNHLYKGGLWLKKQQVIYNDLKAAGYNQLTAQSDMKEKFYASATDAGKDYRKEYVTTSSVPSTAALTNTSDYFFLPSSGYFLSGTLYGLGEQAYYWSSSGYPMEFYNRNRGDRLFFYDKSVNVYYNNRHYGHAIGTFE